MTQFGRSTGPSREAPFSRSVIPRLAPTSLQTRCASWCNSRKCVRKTEPMRDPPLVTLRDRSGKSRLRSCDSRASARAMWTTETWKAQAAIWITLQSTILWCWVIPALVRAGSLTRQVLTQHLYHTCPTIVNVYEWSSLLLSFSKERFPSTSCLDAQPVV